MFSFVLSSLLFHSQSIRSVQVPKIEPINQSINESEPTGFTAAGRKSQG